MVKERSTRISVNLEAELITKDKHYTGVIDSLSHTGIRIKIDPEKTARDFPPETAVQVEFQLISGETLKPIDETLRLNCKVIRGEKISKGSSPINLSLEITELSPLYEEFLKIIHYTHLKIL
jgi:hypothetical protein